MHVFIVLKKNTLEYQATFSTREKAENAIARLSWMRDCQIYTIVVDHYVEDGFLGSY